MTLQKKIQQGLFPFFEKIFGFGQKAKLLSVDFGRPWWQPITDQKWMVGLALITYILKAAIIALLPILLGLAISESKYDQVLWILLAWLAIQILNSFGEYLYILAAARTIGSVHYTAHRFFLTVDPIFHTTRSSGKIITKVNRGTDSYEEVMDIIVLSGIQVGVSMIVLVTTLSSFDLWLGLVAGVGLGLVGTVSVVSKLLISSPLEKRWIKDEDALKAASIENLQQVNLIRAGFASPEQDGKLVKRNRKMIGTTATVWYIHTVADLLIQVLHILSVAVLAWLIARLVAEASLDPIVGVSLIVTYLAGSGDIAYIGGRLRHFLESLTRVKDLFKFIRGFGQQSYPVLGGDMAKPVNNNQSSIQIADLSFSYDDGQEIFDGHKLYLQQDLSDNNHLFGIIGPSGAGKTTFLSILGGQLKPPLGRILIDGQEIYTVDDLSRRELLAVQMQTATSLRGELRYNLLFGLPGNEELDSFLDLDPEDDDYQEVLELIEAEKQEIEKERIYSDQELVSVLKKVGLWSIFKGKKGLDTLIGEGGLNLSGGQRQRLNFANLYLRAKYFRPSVILIDEPTSSLDEISEKAVTDMILELSNEALTLVIAHRLKTLEMAKGILDFSLNQQEKQMQFYTLNELGQRSAYYQKLISGELKLDE